MEKTPELFSQDKQICNYITRYTDQKKDSFCCYQSNRKQINDFYSSMSQHFFNKKIKQNKGSQRHSCKQTRNKQKMISNIKNPLKTTVPKEIEQNNEIIIGNKNIKKIEFEPMFSGVERSSKKGQYIIAKQVKSMIFQDIKQMNKKKQQEQFKKKFPPKYSKKTQFNPNHSKTEGLIKMYNRILSKYKSQNIGDLKLIDQHNFPELCQDLNFDNKDFSILALFKKLYYQTGNGYLTDNLLKYILKFKQPNKIASRIMKQKAVSTKPSVRHSLAMPSDHIVQDGQQRGQHSKKNSDMNQTSSKSIWFRSNNKVQSDFKKNRVKSFKQLRNRKIQKIKLRI